MYLSKISLLLFIIHARARTFPFETTRLSEEDIQTFPAASFGDLDTAPAWDSWDGVTPTCRAWPGTNDWPADAEWAQLNATLGGALLRPVPVAAACHVDDVHYNETTCRWLVEESGQTHAWLDDPLSTLTQWPQGGTCRLALNTPGECTRGGYPEYVVNATTVKHIQAAVNFARNKNVRLVIKNTGHDFAGRAMGAGSLSIWVHNIKDFEFIPEYTVGLYKGMAVQVGAGLESWEHRKLMAKHNISVVTPEYKTVGAVGGWISVAGHGWLTSKFGLGADQVLAINVVTADGRFRMIDMNSEGLEEELWWALRGGGPSTFGVITSVILRAYPAVTLTRANMAFSVSSSDPPSTHAAFWNAISSYYLFCTNTITSNGGYCHDYIYPLGNNSFNFSTQLTLPDLSQAQTVNLLNPMYKQLGQPLPEASSIQIFPYADANLATPPSLLRETRYRSRIFPGYLFRNNSGVNTEIGWEEVFASVRRAVEEGGYTFHGVGYAVPTPAPVRPEAEARWSDAGAVNIAWRWPVVLLGSLVEEDPIGTVLSVAEARARDERARKYVGVWQDLMPGVGAYLNEGDPMEEEWEWRFYGGDMRRLAGVKRNWDPWGVFWAPTTPGSSEWYVATEYPGAQNGRLCRKRSDEPGPSGIR
ncbi:hypothetical protein VTJ49DRAFT_1445 [Mycothermus thermophilus]|uniref:FAD-binding PCMH-type domain-containing protein n=1 Tax=Humicola insolens TaxID=85995 RepID=A0ABR3VDA9_HUMIN